MQDDEDVKRKRRKAKKGASKDELADFSDNMLRVAQQHERNKSDCTV